MGNRIRAGGAGGALVLVLLTVCGCFSSAEEAPQVPRAESGLEDHWYNSAVTRPLFGDFDNVANLQLLPTDKDAAELAARGGYLTKHVAACGACHGKRIADPESPLSGGHVHYDRFGEVRAANITPDRRTGIGSWSVGEIMRAIRASIDRNGKPLSIDVHESYRWLSDRDAQAISFYLLTAQPVRKTIERRELGPFERNRFALFPQHTDFKGYIPEFSRNNEVAYGRYLSRHVAQCYSCHTAPETLLSSPTAFGGSKNKYEAFSDLILNNFLSDESKAEADLLSPEARKELQIEATKRSVWWDSGEDTPETVHAPDVRGGVGTALGEWSEAAIKQYLSTGDTPEGRRIEADHCPWRFYASMSDVDKTAVAKFLKSLS